MVRKRGVTTKIPPMPPHRETIIAFNGHVGQGIKVKYFPFVSGRRRGLEWLIKWFGHKVGGGVHGVGERWKLHCLLYPPCFFVVVSKTERHRRRQSAYAKTLPFLGGTMLQVGNVAWIRGIKPCIERGDVNVHALYHCVSSNYHHNNNPAIASANNQLFYLPHCYWHAGCYECTNTNRRRCVFSQ